MAINTETINSTSIAKLKYVIIPLVLYLCICLVWDIQNISLLSLITTNIIPRTQLAIREANQLATCSLDVSSNSGNNKYVANRKHTEPISKVKFEIYVVKALLLLMLFGKNTAADDEI